MTMGERITALRKGRGFTQEQLAERLSVSRQSVSKWELDQATPEVGCAVALCDLFEVSLDYLIRGIEEPPPVEERKTVPPTDPTLPTPAPSRPEPLTAKGYAMLFGLLLLLTAGLCLHLLVAFHSVGAEAGAVAILLIFGVTVPLPAVYLATRRWYYADDRHALRHLWGVMSATAVIGNLLMLGGIMLYLRCFADEFVFWSVSWAEVWCRFLTAELLALSALLPFLLRFREKKWLCWVGYALSQGVYMLGLISDFALTELIPSEGAYWALWDAAVRLGVILLLALSQLILYIRLRDGASSLESETRHPLSAGAIAGRLAICTLAVPSVGGGIYYALALAGLPTEFLPLWWSSLPALSLLLARGKGSLSFRSALAKVGTVTALFLPLLLAVHMGTAYLTQYLLTFGGPMPDLQWGVYLLRSAVSALIGGGLALLSSALLRKRRWAGVWMGVGLLIAAAMATALIPC